MPVRDKAIDQMIHEEHGSVVYNSAAQTVRVDGKKMTRDEFDRDIFDPADRRYWKLMDSIDWNRVLLEASARHLHLDHNDGDEEGSLMFGVEGVCGECLAEAILNIDFGGRGNWAEQPKAPRDRYECYVCHDTGLISTGPGVQDYDPCTDCDRYENP